jgi:hypothetical protein
VLSVLQHPTPEEEHVKSDEEMVRILEAFDLTRNFRDAGELTGCLPDAVANYVAMRDQGRLPA